MELYTLDKNEKVFLSDEIIKENYNKKLIHQIINSELSINRKNIKLNKNRSTVSGSNKKPWKQKGTGRARSGDKKSPIWRSGGVTFGNQIRNFKNKINKKMYKICFKNIISYFINNKKIIILSDLKINSHKTKELINIFKKLSLLNKKMLILLDKIENNLVLSSNNIFNIDIINIFNISISKIFNYEYIIFTIKSIKILEEKIK